ncbi:hypothetical protein LshimejAT787_0102040 [Lyophyllum shimeji]|uniref:Uncharacterized protein n=1 Tax=Lyophyllum shimeji TaxID=47721 RepID=A0A9P3PC95_LYOSH|nr:hypothetical protein LshimejAT787_0102040 [Lyophyllum shimeji]
MISIKPTTQNVPSITLLDAPRNPAFKRISKACATPPSQDDLETFLLEVKQSNPAQNECHREKVGVSWLATDPKAGYEHPAYLLVSPRFMPNGRAVRAGSGIAAAEDGKETGRLDDPARVKRPRETSH